MVFSARALGVLALLGAWTSWGVGGPMFREVRTTSSVLRLSWRGQSSMCFAAVPFVIILALDARARTVNRDVLTGIAAVGTSMFVMFVGWNHGIDLTAFSHVAVLAQTHPMFLCVWQAARKRFGGVGRAPSRNEWIGVVASFGGVALTATAKGKSGAARPPTLVGDVAALSCGIAGAAYALSIQKWFGSSGIGIKNCPAVYVQTTAATVMTLWSLLVLACVPGQVWVSSAPPYNKGVFDWPKSDDFWPGVVAIGTLAILGHAFLTAAMLKLPILVCSLAMTMTPIMQSAFSVLLLDDDPPSVQGILGGVIVILGIAFTLFYGHRESNIDQEAESERAGVSLVEITEAHEAPPHEGFALRAKATS